MSWGQRHFAHFLFALLAICGLATVLSARAEDPGAFFKGQTVRFLRRLLAGRRV